MTSKKQRIGAKSLRPYVSFKSVASLLLVVVCTSLWAIVWFTGPETTRADEVGIQ
ncbi:MAG: hypothetical protein LBD75_08170 [Candidatus Peribacteria bacterium]|jgi:hypothetical protein|nr:hypothetical protein [Candidatus Peribacteria bacterium]